MTAFLPWRVVHVAIDESLPDLRAEPQAGGLFMVFWCDGTPLGQLMIPAPLLPIGRTQLATAVSRVVAPAIGHRVLKKGFQPPLPIPLAKQVPEDPPELKQLLDLSRPLESLRQNETSPKSRGATPGISIVVCTRNRPQMLEKCLSSIAALSPAASDVVVVDNDPASGSTRRVTDRFPEVLYVPEERPGLSVARNTGLRNCASELVAFTDDDVVVHPRWIGALREAFSDPTIVAVTGLVLPAEIDTRAQYVFQAEMLGWGWGYRAMEFDREFFDSTRRVGVPAWRLGAGANMAFRREAFERVGLFDERLGAGASGCSEDSELWYRLLAERCRCRYEPGAVVFHHHRPDWQGLCDQLYSYMRGHVTALFVQFERHGHWGNIYRAFVGLPSFLARMSYGSAKRRVRRLLYDRGTDGLSQPLMPQIRGALAGYGYYLRHRRRPAAVSGPAGVRAPVHARRS